VVLKWSQLNIEFTKSSLSEYILYCIYYVSKFGYLGNLSMSRSSSHECRDNWTWKRSDGVATQVKNVLGCERVFFKCSCCDGKFCCRKSNS